MFFWKVFAWIALGWGLKNGRGVIIRKSSEKADTEKDESQRSGPGWRLVSSGGPYPGRKRQQTPDSSADGASKEGEGP